MKVFRNTPNTSVTVDGEKRWLSRSVAVGVVICCVHKGIPLFLVTKRGRDVADTGKFCFVCGYLDYDETLEEAVLREAWEEIGLDLTLHENIAPDGLSVPWRVDSTPAKRQDITMFFSFVFHAENVPKPTIRNEGEVAKAGWLTLESLAKIRQDDFAYAHKELLQNWIKLKIKNSKD